MKLFVFTEPYQINYGGCSLYIIARDYDHALLLASSPHKSRFIGIEGADQEETGYPRGSLAQIPFEEIEIGEGYVELAMWAE